MQIRGCINELYLINPFDPLDAALIRGDKSEGVTMSLAELLICDVGCESVAKSI